MTNIHICFHVTELQVLVQGYISEQQRIRVVLARYGKPINVNSGYRCQALNKAVGGVSNSQHLTGEAADIDTGSKTENRKLAKMIVDMRLPFDQLIDEADYAWVHVSYKCKGDNRGQILRMKNGKYKTIKAEEL